jgi:hypothetical protein
MNKTYDNETIAESEIDLSLLEKIGIMTINVRHNLINSIYEVLEEAKRHSMEILFITETGLQENNI